MMMSPVEKLIDEEGENIHPDEGSTNTSDIFAMVGSSCSTFIASYYFNKAKFSMVDVQNATLAGGVAIGTASSMAVAPGGALAVGLSAGVLSVVGYNAILPSLQKRIGLHDTCGVHNLYGMPGVLAGIAGAIAAGGATEAKYKSTASLCSAFPARFDSTCTTEQRP